MHFPPISHPGYLVLKPLCKQLLTETRRLEKEKRNNQIIIDIGCNDKPYLPFFTALSKRYVGIDIYNCGSADILGLNSNLPLKDACADIVLCTQVLEHSEDPNMVMSEIYRILRPNGIVMLSTHGVFVYHPWPNDYRRWTHEGLKLEFKKAGLKAARILPNGGPIACLFYLCVTMLSMLAYHSKLLAPLYWFLIPIFNFTGEKLDKFILRFFPASRFLLVANYLALSEK